MHTTSKFSSIKKDSDKEKKGKHSEPASRSDNLVNESALPGACWNNDYTLVKSILAKDSCNVNFLNERTQTGLYCAARQGHSDIMIELVNHKNINPNVICAQGSTALHAACFGGHPEAVAILLMSGSDPEIKSSLGLIPKQESKMSVIIDLFKTFESNPEDLKLDFPILKKINLRNEKLKAAVAHRLGRNQNLHPAAFPKMTKSVVDMVLMNQPVKPDTAETLLAKLSRKEQLLVERLSFESNYQSFQCQVSFDDNETENPGLACLQVEIKDHFLFVYLDPEQLKVSQFEAWRKFSPLYREDELSDLTEKICEAINENSEAALASALLLPFAFVAVNQPGSEGKFPLLLAVQKNSPRVLLALLNHGSVQVNQPDEKTGDTALHFAARNNYATLVALLLYGQASPNLANHKGESARDLINKQPATSKTREVLRLVDENALLLTEKMKEAYPILNDLHPHELQFQMPLGATTEEEKKAVFDRLNDYCVNGKAADLQNLLTQHESVVHKVINHVNDRGLDLDAVISRLGQTPLYIASRQGHADIVKILLEIESINKEFQVVPHKGTALHAASFNGFGKIVAMLLFAGADCTIKNAQGLTPKQEAKGDSIEAYYLFQNNLPQFKSTYNVTQPLHMQNPGATVKKPVIINHNDPTIMKFKFNIPTIKEYNLNLQKQSISIKFFDFRYIRIVLTELVDYVVISAIIEKNKQIFLHERRGEQIPFTTQTFLGEKKEDLFVYDPVSYYSRLGFTVREDLQFSHWVIMPFENHHSLVILETLPEQDVSLIQKFHYQGGIPVLSWSSQSNGKLLRCQRPITCIGTTGPLLAQHENDPYLKQQIFASLNYMEDLNMNSNSPITIIDCGKMNLDLTSMHKSRREMKFLEISFENLHAYNYEMINKSEFPLKDNKIDNSAWRDMVGIILRHTQMIQKKILKNQCVIIQGAGPDYRCVDSILSCLVQISLDPHFRKIEGFLQLLRKDWFLEGVLPWENPSGSTKSVVNNPFPGLYYNQAHSVMFINSNRNAVRPAQHSQSNQPPPRPKNEAPLCSIDHGSSFPFFLLLVSCIQELKNYFPVAFEWRDSFLSDVLGEYHFHALEPVYETKFSDKTLLEIFTKDFTLRQQDASNNDPQPLTLSSIEWARKSNEYFPRVNHYFDVLISRLRRYPALYFEHPEQALDPTHQSDPNERELKFDDFLYDKSRSTSEYSPFVVNKQLYRAFEILDSPRKDPQRLEMSVARIFRLPDIVMPYFQDLTHLALSCNLSALPKSFAHMPQIQSLVLSRNRFSSFPTVLLAFARSLTSLDLSDNVLQFIPPTITQLSNLQLLNLESNKLKEFNLPLDEASALLSARLHRHHGSIISSVSPALNASPTGSSPSSKPQLLGASNKNIEQLQAGMQMARHKSTNLKRVTAQDREAIRIDTKSLSATHARAEGLSKLKKLIIAFNNITTIPNFLSLSSLEYLAVNNNPLTQLPDRFIASITNCTHLDASSSSLRLLSSSWNNLANLTSLNLSLNRISELPPSIVDCVNLKQLFLENNKFRNFPHPIKYLLNLEILNLSHNEIKFVPFWIGKLTKMKRLLLRGNQIILVSIAISSLENLLTLDLRDNFLNAIPHSVVLLKKLETLNVNGNPNLKKFENMKFSDIKTCLRELKKEEDAQMAKLQKANIMFLSPSNVATQDSLFAKVFDTKVFKLIPALESVGLTDITSDNLKFQSLIYHDPKKSPDEIRTEVCLMRDVRILEGIFPIFIRDEFTFVLSLDLALARDLLISQIRYWCLNLVTRIRKPRVIFVFFGVEEWRKKNPGHSKTAVAEACSSIFDECLKDKVFQKVKNPQHFHCDDHFREAGVEQVRAALIAAVLDAPKKEFKLKYIKFITMLEELSVEKLKRNEHPVLTHEDFIFMANTALVGIQKIIEIEEIKGILDSNLSIIMKYLGQSDIDGIIVIDPKWLGRLFAKFLTSTDMISQFLFVNGIFASYEMQNLLFNFYETSRPFLLFLLDRFDLVVTLQRKKQLPNLLTMRKNTQLNVGFYGTLQKHSELEVDIYFYLKGALPESPNKDSAQLSMKRLREEHPNKIVLQRVVKMNFFSSDLFAMIVGKVLDIVMVENPRESLEAWNNSEKGISCVTIKLHQAEIAMRRTTVALKKNEKNFAYHLSLLVIGEAEFSVDAFSTICSAFYDCMYDTKIDFKSFLVLESEELVDVVEFEQFLEDALNDIEYRGEKMNLFQQIPEKFLPFYKGNRYSMAHFDKKKLLGKGGFAEVFLAAHKAGGAEYAIKELIMNAKDKSAKKYYSTFKEFAHEIEIQGALAHPNILKMIEFCAYGDLYGFLTNWEKPFPNALRVKFTRDLASALQYLQDLDPPIAHIDFKSPNIFLYSLDPEAPVCAKVADFGTSHRVLSPITIRYVDNATWLAPEVLSGEPYDQMVDTYALGAVVWEMVVRKRYLSDIHELDIVDTIVSGERPAIPPFCLPQIATVIAACWENNPANRASMRSVLNVLDQITKDDIAQYDAQCAVYDQELKQQWDQEALEREQARKEKEDKDKGDLSHAKSSKKSKRDVTASPGMANDSGTGSTPCTPHASTGVPLTLTGSHNALTSSNPNVAIASQSQGASPVVPSRPGASLPSQNPARPERSPTLERTGTGSESARSTSSGRDEKKEKKSEVKSEKSVKKTSIGQAHRPAGGQEATKPIVQEKQAWFSDFIHKVDAEFSKEVQSEYDKIMKETQAKINDPYGV